MRFSVLTPAFNCAKFIRTNFASVRAQGIGADELEHWVIDGGSTDGTVEILKQEPGIHWVSERDRGLSDAVNKGVQRARGDWIVWLNADDALAPGALAAFLRAVKEHPTARVFCGAVTILRYDGSVEQTVPPWDYNLKDLLGSRTGINQPSTIVHREVFTKAGLLDVNDRYAMDYEWMVRVMHHYRCVTIPEVLAFSHRRRGSITDANMVRQFRRFLEIRRRYRQPYFCRAELRVRFYLYTDGLRKMPGVRRGVRAFKRLLGRGNHRAGRLCGTDGIPSAVFCDSGASGAVPAGRGNSRGAFLGNSFRWSQPGLSTPPLTMRVCIVPEYPASLMTGGLQVQAEETHRALVTSGGGMEAELFNWSERRPLADLYHFIGFPPYLCRITELLREAQRPYLITMLFGSNRRRSGLRLARLRWVIRSNVLRLRDRYEAIHGARAIITITDADAEAARYIHSLEAGRVHVVNNGVGEPFFTASDVAWRQEYDDRPFALCVGAIQPRKGHLLLVQACNKLQIPVVLLGPVLPGEAIYAAQVEGAMRQNQAVGGRWLKGLRNEDPLLVSAYGACRMVALLSQAETQPLSVMQAMAARKPVLLLRASYAEDALFRGLPTVEHAKVESVAQTLGRLWKESAATNLAREFTWSEVARRLQQIYDECLIPPTVG